MKVMVRRNIRHWSQVTLFTLAATMLAYCSFFLMDAWIFQRQESNQLQLLNTTPAASHPLPLLTTGLIGRIEIPRLGVSAIIIEGISTTTLRRAVGHIPGTAMPGQPGTVGISGHRDTFFRPLRNIRQNDIITLTTLRGDYRYRVVSTRIVSPLNVAVLYPGKNEILTLVTCYPFYFIGSAPDRFIVRAERINEKNEPTKKGAPASSMASLQRGPIFSPVAPSDPQALRKPHAVR